MEREYEYVVSDYVEHRGADSEYADQLRDTVVPGKAEERAVEAAGDDEYGVPEEVFLDQRIECVGGTQHLGQGSCEYGSEKAEHCPYGRVERYGQGEDLVRTIEIFAPYADCSYGEGPNSCEHGECCEEHYERECDVDGTDCIYSHPVAHEDAVHNSEEEDAHHAEYRGECIAYKLTGLVLHCNDILTLLTNFVKSLYLLYLY